MTENDVSTQRVQRSTEIRMSAVPKDVKMERANKHVLSQRR